jgi:hypothetical protein
MFECWHDNKDYTYFLQVILDYQYDLYHGS